jgi:hypothetical protein
MLQKFTLQKENSVLASEAVTLAAMLYQHPSVKDIEDMIEAFVTGGIPGISPLAEVPFDTLFVTSREGFKLGLYHYTCRVLLCEAMQQILALDLESTLAVPVPFQSCRLAIEAEDVAAAKRIAQCAQFALQLDPHIPVGHIRVRIPSLVAWGAWDRLETRFRADDVTLTATQARERARLMKAYCVGVVDRIQKAWGGGKSRTTDLWPRHHTLHNVVPISAAQTEIVCLRGHIY